MVPMAQSLMLLMTFVCALGVPLFAVLVFKGNFANKNDDEPSLDQGSKNLSFDPCCRGSIP